MLYVDFVVRRGIDPEPPCASEIAVQNTPVLSSTAMVEIDLLPLWLSLRVASISTFFVAVAGTALGWLLAKKEFRGREVIDALATLPLILPPTVLGYYLLVLFGANGPLGRAIESITGEPVVFTIRGAIIAATVGAFPLMLKTARASISNVDSQYEDAARTLGLSEWQVLRRVTLPLSARGLLAGAALAFARALGDFGATLMVAGNIRGRTQTAALAIYDATQAGADSQALTLVIVLSAFAFIILYATNRLTASKIF